MSDFATMLLEAAQQPVIIFLCAICVFVAGILAGLLARTSDPDDANDAGDTHANLSTLPPPTRRVRAISSAIKPSYDSRKAPKA
jgi:hypothetical protein